MIRAFGCAPRSLNDNRHISDDSRETSCKTYPVKQWDTTSWIYVVLFAILKTKNSITISEMFFFVKKYCYKTFTESAVNDICSSQSSLSIISFLSSITLPRPPSWEKTRFYYELTDLVILCWSLSCVTSVPLLLLRSWSGTIFPCLSFSEWVRHRCHPKKSLLLQYCCPILTQYTASPPRNAQLSQLDLVFITYFIPVFVCCSLGLSEIGAEGQKVQKLKLVTFFLL